MCFILSLVQLIVQLIRDFVWVLIGLHVAMNQLLVQFIAKPCRQSQSGPGIQCGGVQCALNSTQQQALGDLIASFNSTCTSVALSSGARFLLGAAVCDANK